MLKDALTSALALMLIDYKEGASKVILTIDSSVIGFGSVLIQLNN